jgi:hypothetical protein
LARAIRDDGYDSFKALATLCIFEGLLLVTTVAVVSLVVRKNLLALAGRSGAIVFVAVGGASMALINYYLLETAGQFEREFKRYSSRALLLGRIALFFIVLLVVVSTFILVGPVRKLQP